MANIVNAHEEQMKQLKGQQRLPTWVVPKHYDLTLNPDLLASNFTGNVLIHLSVLDPTCYLVLNSLGLIIHEVSFTTNQRKHVPCDIVVDDENEILVLVFEEALSLGDGILSISLSGILDEHMKGFYRGTYVDGGVKKNMAVTQFEAVDARKCFPCWDEPALKATFKITVGGVPSKLTVLSNMPVYQENHDGLFKSVHFEESPIMSTYLVAVVIGLFDYIEDKTSDGIIVRAYCPVGKSEKGKLALNIAVKALGIYKAYFSLPYSLPKLDMVAVPDFFGGAMENYGLIVYRETELLHDDLHSAAANTQRLAIVVTHEVAHQWFGNLVTMEWWTHLWLNEGFATWISYLATDIIYPEWRIWTQFLDISTGGLRMDALETSHPIEVEVHTARAVDETFDAISYKKGSSVIRMLEDYLGADIFQICYAIATISSEVIPDSVAYLKQFFIKLIFFCAEKLGWEPVAGESHLNALLREEVLVALATFDHGETHQESMKRLQSYLDDRNTSLLSVKIKKAAYISVMHNTSTIDRYGYESLLTLYRETDVMQEKTRILGSIASSCSNPAIIVEVLDFMLSNEVREQDAIYVTAGISLEGRETAWTWFKENWDSIVKKWGTGMIFHHFIRDIIRPLCSHEKADEVEAFFVDRTNPSFAMNLKQSIEQIRIKARLVEKIKQEESLEELVKELAGEG